ncbi:MAG: protein kinase [Prevotella sp.]|nr:protein kinase [Prevotella sp.]
MAYTEPTSAFIKPDNIIQTTHFTDFSTVPSRGYSLLVRAKRHGRWWMLKGLKEPYRNDTVYQVLLQKEYEITSQLQHPMVASVFSLEEVEGLGLCIVMEWIEGQTLKEWLAQGKHTLKQRRHVADMLLEVLAYVQSRQTQHRDLKPSNIIITHDGLHLKLIDFGLSDTDSHAVLKAPAGTEGYMAPEGSSDIYSLGCILRELHLGWWSRMVIRKCCAPSNQRYTDVETIKRDLHRCWQWPRRMLLLICFVALATGLSQLNRMYTQQGQQTVSDSLKVLKEESHAKTTIEQATTDSLQLQINHIHEQQQAEQNTLQKHQDYIAAAKRKIDQQMAAYGIQQMFDTVTCQRNITIPFLRITDTLIKETKEPELKEYIQDRYRKPWIKRMKELPFD